MKNLLFYLICFLVILFGQGCKSSSKMEQKSTLKVDSTGQSSTTTESKKNTIVLLSESEGMNYEWAAEEYIPVKDSTGKVTGSVLKSRNRGKLNINKQKEQTSKSSSSEKNKKKEAAKVKKDVSNKIKDEEKSETTIASSLTWGVGILIIGVLVGLYIRKKWVPITAFFKKIKFLC